MGMYNLATITKKIYNSDLKLFTSKAVKDILEIDKESTLYSVIGKLLKNRILVRVEKGKYALEGVKVHDFVLANFLYRPSYVSFEVALNFYSILSQFPYEISSITNKKTVKKIVDEKIFSYTHVKRNLFWGYEKKDQFLIALPEKALLDQLYLASKGLKKVNLDEYDFSLINWSKFDTYLKKYPKTKQLNKIIDTLKKVK